ncbi:phosphotriesterase-related protein [Nocardioides sp. WS12]|uniref:phosphotriesterase family protein n=1 Tax=Nocardioides sp. WS12 TaxID=2486272 RepID=UPI0015F84BD5|nr:phosphotriesterase-related protein [Nocardioides sp. WS12]
MATVQTVNGEVECAELGRVLMHEHVFVQNHEFQVNYPETWDDEARTDDAVRKFVDLKASGIDTIVDLTVLGLGRDIRRVQAVAERSPVRIIAATGYYTFADLPTHLRVRGPGRMFGGEEPLLEMFVRDITEGIAGTGIRAGILKCVTDAPGVTPDVERILRSVARAHLQTGVPISTHTDAIAERGLDQQRIFLEEGVDLGRVVIGHSGDTEDLDYLQRLIDAGSYVGMDRFGLDGFMTFEKRVATVAALVERGYASRIVLSHDTSCHSANVPDEYREKNWPNWQFLHITEDVVPALLEAGVTSEQIVTMLEDNPREIFSGASSD